jgi:hypothetical protein
MTKSLLLTFCALLSLSLVYSTPVTTEFTIDGNGADWDTAKVAPAFQKGTSFNKVNMQSTGLHTYACASQVTQCTATQPWIGSVRAFSPFVDSVSYVANVLLPAEETASNQFANCIPHRGKPSKAFVLPAVASVAGNLRVTAVAATPLAYDNGFVALENFPQSSLALTLVFSQTFPAVKQSLWLSIPTTTTTGVPSCAEALPNRELDCPSGLFYYKSYGIVFLSGLFFPSSSVIATLPEAARPQYDNDYVVSCDVINIGYVTVKTTGEVIFSGQASKWCSLDGISYLFASEIPGGSGPAPFNFKFASLYRSPASDSRSPVVAVTKQYGVQFLAPFQNGNGLTLASFDAPNSCPDSVEVTFPVVIDSQLAFARSTVAQGTFTFSLESSNSLSPVANDFGRVFAAQNTATGYFALLIQGYGTPASLIFTFTNAEGAPQAVAQFTLSTQLLSVTKGITSFTQKVISAAGNNLFELSFSEPSLVQAGNKVTVTVGADSFAYYFN